MPGSSRIQPIVKGDINRTLLHASLGNEIIDTCNAFRTMTLLPDGIGQLEIGKDTAKLQLSSIEVTLCVNGQPKTATLVGVIQ